MSEEKGNKIVVDKSISNIDKENKKAYLKENVKKDVQFKQLHFTATGEKEKYIQKKTYSNGVVKSSLVGLKKGNKVIMDKGIKK